MVISSHSDRRRSVVLFCLASGEFTGSFTSWQRRNRQPGDQRQGRRCWQHQLPPEQCRKTLVERLQYQLVRHRRCLGRRQLLERCTEVARRRIPCTLVVVELRSYIEVAHRRIPCKLERKELEQRRSCIEVAHRRIPCMPGQRRLEQRRSCIEVAHRRILCTLGWVALWWMRERTMLVQLARRRSSLPRQVGWGQCRWHRPR